MDRHTAEQRSKNMAAVKSKGNKTTELTLLRLFRQNKMTGWRRHMPNIYGKPDFLFVDKKVVVFADGCFWHGCTRCKNIPKSKKAFWVKKIGSNIKRDVITSKELKRQGWRVVRVWEHDLKESGQKCIRKIASVLEK